VLIKRQTGKLKESRLDRILSLQSKKRREYKERRVQAIKGEKKPRGFDHVWGHLKKPHVGGRKKN